MKTNLEEIVQVLITKVKQFEYRIESVDHFWDIIFPDKMNKYHHIRMIKSHEDFYLTHIDGNLCTLEIKQNKGVRAASSFGFNSYQDMSHDPERGWKALIISACKWLDYVKKNWIKAAKEVLAFYPLNRRYGIVPNGLVRSSLEDLYRIDDELGKAKTKKSFI